MTVEERAKTVTDEVGTATTGAELRALIVQALRDQIEDCEGSRKTNPRPGFSDRREKGEWEMNKVFLDILRKGWLVIVLQALAWLALYMLVRPYLKALLNFLQAKGH